MSVISECSKTGILFNHSCMIKLVHYILVIMYETFFQCVCIRPMNGLFSISLPSSYCYLSLVMPPLAIMETSWGEDSNRGRGGNWKSLVMSRNVSCCWRFNLWSTDTLKKYLLHPVRELFAQRNSLSLWFSIQHMSKGFLFIIKNVQFYRADLKRVK